MVSSVIKKIHQESLLVSCLSAILLLLAPLIFFTKFTEYGLLQPAILGLAGIVLSLGGLCGWLLWRAGWATKVFLLTLLIVVSLSFLPAFISINYLYLLLFLALAFSTIFARRACLILAIMLVQFIIGLLIFPIQHPLTHPKQEKFSAQAYNKNLPPIIHIILDEHIGIDGIPEDIGQGQQLKQQLSDFYIQHGFHLYANAYSHYNRTYNSIPNLFNFMPKAIDSDYFKSFLQDKRLKRNAYFELLNEQGYRFKIYQANYINYCALSDINYASCYTYPVTNINYIKDLGLSAWQRFLFVSKSYLLTSSIFKNLQLYYKYNLRPNLAVLGVDFPAWTWDQANVSTLAIPETFKQIAQDMQQDSGGTVFFAHLLLPHSPYIFDQQCHVIPKVKNWYVNHNDSNWVINTPESRLLRYHYYENQLGCTYIQLDNLFTQLKKSGVYDKAIIIVHGDHGSRIMENGPFRGDEDVLNKQDIEDGYSTLFAVKAPWQQAQVDEEFTPINILLARYLTKLTGQYIYSEVQHPYVFLTPKVAFTHEVMPEFNIDQLKNTHSNQ